MTVESRLTLHRGLALLVAIALLLTGGGAMYLLMRTDAAGREEGRPVPATEAGGAPSRSAPAVAAAPEPSSTAQLPEIVVPLAPDAVERAGIVVGSVATAPTAGELRLPGIVEPNAYRQVAVTPLVSGRITHVSARLGDRVRRGQSIAEIYSPELAEAQTRYVSAGAMLEAHERELQRTQKLVDIGAASRQELERTHAEHAAQTAAVQSARSQLQLLGMSSSTLDALTSGEKVSATISVPAPSDGVVTERAANVGLNIDTATKLFTIVDLSTVWIVADMYEKDFSRIRVGMDTTITTAAYPGLALHGRISYIDPQLSADTRTAKVRVEVPNPRGELRLSMYADVVVTGLAGAAGSVVPRSAVQNVGDRTVVYLVNPSEPGRFIEREVRLGQVAGDRVQVAAGVQPGDTIVVDGSFFIRAERDRLGLRPAASGGADAKQAARALTSQGNQAVQAANVVVNEKGFAPTHITVRAGTPARLTFVRTTDKTCGTEVVFASLNIKRTLPLNEPVVIEFTPTRTGDIAFACGMNMLRGTVMVR